MSERNRTFIDLGGEFTKSLLIDFFFQQSRQLCSMPVL